MIKSLWVQISSHQALDGNGVKRMPSQLVYPILVHLQKERKYKKPNGANEK